jgi:hypothetical protein
VILLVGIAIALVISLLFGGRLANLGQVHLRLSYLFPLALLLQVLIFSPAWQARLGAQWGAALYALSLLVLLPAVWVNRRVQGIALLGVGLMLNASVILANGGHMPASLEALRSAGILAPNATFEAIHVTNSSLISSDTPLWPLGDIFAIPRPWPLANIFSVGDVLIGAGAAWFVWAHTHPGAVPPDAAPPVRAPLQ